MQDFHSIVYSKNVIEFVAVAKEFCEFMENMGGGKKRQAVAGIQKFIPLVYLKGAMLPRFDLEVSGLSEDFVTEDDYNFLFAGWEKLMGEYDEYLEVFDEAMQYSELPVIHTVSEKLCDIYQDLKNFISAYRSGMETVMIEAIWVLSEGFENYWGKAAAELLRAVHSIVYRLNDEDELC